MEERIHFQIITADGASFDWAARYIDLPLEDGAAGFLPGHAPLIAAVREGVVKVEDDEGTDYMSVSAGVFHIANGEATLLVQVAENGRDIDLARALAAEKRARERLADKSAGFDMIRAEVSLHRSLARQKAYALSHEK